MPNRSRKKRPADPNQMAAGIVDEATSEFAKQVPQKNPHAVALGSLGGIKGGPARFKKLTSKRRKAIAMMGAKARWKNKRKSE
jgi:hypothetical protein